MLPYYIFAGILAFQAAVAKPGTASNQRSALWLSTLLLIIFIGLRLQVGADWYIYLRLFRHVGDLDRVLTSADPGYFVLNWFFRKLDVGIWAVNLTCAVIFALSLRSFCLKQSDPKLAMMVAFPYLVTVVAMGYTRQGVAIGLVLTAIVAALDGKLVKTALALAVAITFHRSAVIAIPLVMLALSDTKIKMLLVAMVGAVCYFFFVQTFVESLYDRYVTDAMKSSGAAIRAAMNLVPAILFVALRHRLGFSEQEQRLWFGASAAALICMIILLFSPATTAVDRLALYVIPLQLAVLSRLSTIKGSAIDLRVPVIAYSLTIFVVWLHFGTFSSNWLPYRNYLYVPADFRPSYHRY